jgi:hypothetical protein
LEQLRALGFGGVGRKGTAESLVWLQEASGDEEGPGALGILVDGGAAFVLGALDGTGVDELGALGKMADGNVLVCRRNDGWQRVTGGKTVYKNAVAAGQLDAIDKVLRWRKIESTGFDEVCDIAWRIARGEAPEDFGLIQPSGLSAETWGRQRKHKHEKESARSHGPG